MDSDLFKNVMCRAMLEEEGIVGAKCIDREGGAQ